MTFAQSTLPNHACFLTVSIPCGPAPSRCNEQPHREWSVIHHPITAAPKGDRNRSAI